MKNKIFTKKVFIFLLVFIFVTIVFFGSYYLLKNDFRIKSFNKEYSYNYKEEFKYVPAEVCYGNIFSCKKIKSINKGKVDTSKLGKYNIKYSYNYKDKKYVLNQLVYVKDSIKPVLKIEDKKALLCSNGNVSKLNITVTDNYDKDLSNKIKYSYNKDKDRVIVEVTDSNKNTTYKELEVIKEDKINPVIELNGLSTRSFVVGDTYTDEGAKAIDNCDGELKVEVSNNVDFNKPGDYEIVYTAKDSSGNESKVSRKIIVKALETGSRIVYLTFDDGPSEYTSELLDILKKYNVKATFFVTGNGDDNLIKREFDEGHTIALHTNSHNYSYLYSSVNNYFEDLYSIQNKVKNVTGTSPNLIRFPGGSSNTVSMNYDGGIGIMSILTREVEARGFRYFDWNVSSGDAGGTESSDQVYINVISTLKEGSSIVLQHDTKKYSIDAVERIIKYCEENGYTFATLKENSPGAHHGVNN